MYALDGNASDGTVTARDCRNTGGHSELWKKKTRTAQEEEMAWRGLLEGDWGGPSLLTTFWLRQATHSRNERLRLK